MRCVIYDPIDMEPLTIFDVPADYLRAVERGEFPGVLRFPIPAPMKVSWRFPTDEEVLDSIHTLPPVAEIRFEQLSYRGVTCWTGFALNPEMALLLKSEFLPGQQKEVWAERRKGFSEGFSEAFKRLGYGG